jgi:hypothetical protein
LVKTFWHLDADDELQRVHLSIGILGPQGLVLFPAMLSAQYRVDSPQQVEHRLDAVHEHDGSQSALGHIGFLLLQQQLGW